MWRWRHTYIYQLKIYFLLKFGLSYAPLVLILLLPPYFCLLLCKVSDRKFSVTFCLDTTFKLIQYHNFSLSHEINSRMRRLTVEIDYGQKSIT